MLFVECDEKNAPCLVSFAPRSDGRPVLAFEEPTVRMPSRWIEFERRLSVYPTRSHIVPRICLEYRPGADGADALLPCFATFLRDRLASLEELSWFEPILPYSKPARNHWQSFGLDDLFEGMSPPDSARLLGSIADGFEGFIDSYSNLLSSMHRRPLDSYLAVCADWSFRTSFLELREGCFPSRKTHAPLVKATASLAVLLEALSASYEQVDSNDASFIHSHIETVKVGYVLLEDLMSYCSPNEIEEAKRQLVVSCI